MYTAPQTFFFLVKNGKAAQSKPVLGKMSVLRVPAPLLASAPHQGQYAPGKGRSVESLRDNTCLGLGSGSAAQNSRVSQRSQVATSIGLRPGWQYFTVVIFMILSLTGPDVWTLGSHLVAVFRGVALIEVCHWR